MFRNRGRQPSWGGEGRHDPLLENLKLYVLLDAISCILGTIVTKNLGFVVFVFCFFFSKYHATDIA